MTQERRSDIDDPVMQLDSNDPVEYCDSAVALKLDYTEIVYMDILKTILFILHFQDQAGIVSLL